MKRGSSIGQKPHAANRQPKLSKSAKSLRQTGISLRLELGPDLDDRDLAKWARRSPAMIAAFYDQTQIGGLLSKTGHLERAGADHG